MGRVCCLFRGATMAVEEEEAVEDSGRRAEAITQAEIATTRRGIIVDRRRQITNTSPVRPLRFATTVITTAVAAAATEMTIAETPP